MPPSRRAGVVIGCLTAMAAMSSIPAYRSLRGAASAPMGALPEGVTRAELNVLVITLDTTRADRLGAYGAGRVATPNLDRLAREGVLFEQAVSAAPLTLPAHASLFTGLFPPGHGARDNGVRLDSSQVTLAEVLRAHGFRTGAFVASFVLDSRWGLDQGFDRYGGAQADATKGRVRPSELRRRADGVVDEALTWLDSVADTRFMAWLHFYDPHLPYDPPEPYRSQYADEPYHGEIAFMDAQIGRVLAYLDERHLSARTIVVAAGDHGESLGEHGEASHGLFVYESVLRVPLIIRAPFALMRGRRVDPTVRSVDVSPTLLDLLGIEAPRMDGTSLVPPMTGRAPGRSLEAYAESRYPRHFGWSDLRAVRAGRFKLILAPRPELYDLDADPDEKANLYVTRRALAGRLARRLQAIEAAASASPSMAGATGSSAEAASRLAALGYLGGSTQSQTSRGGARLPDPKDQIEVYNKLIDSSTQRGGQHAPPIHTRHAVRNTGRMRR